MDVPWLRRETELRDLHGDPVRQAAPRRFRSALRAAKTAPSTRPRTKSGNHPLADPPFIQPETMSRISATAPTTRYHYRPKPIATSPTRSPTHPVRAYRRRPPSTASPLRDIHLEQLRVVEAPGVTHLKYRVRR